MVWSRFKLHFRITKASKHGEENAESLISSPNVEEEYMEAIRTNSFEEIHCKFQRQLVRKSLDKLSSSSSLPRHVHLSEGLLEPCQENLADIVGDSELQHFLIGFFRISFVACRICELILRSIQQTKANYSSLRRVIKQLKRVSDDHEHYTDDECNRIYGSLSAFSLITNPLSTIKPVQFQEIHDNLYLSLHIFTSKRRKIRRRRKIMRCCKRIAGGALIAAYTTVAITLIVLAIHTTIGMVAAPGLAASSVALIIWRLKWTKLLRKTSYLETLEAQLDTAAKGIYLLINDFDTVSRLVRMLNDEMEHGKFVADLCLRKRKNEMLKEVLKEFRINEIGLMKQLEELKEHVYLCILNINRLRRQLVENMVVCQSHS